MGWCNSSSGAPASGANPNPPAGMETAASSMAAANTPASGPGWGTMLQQVMMNKNPLLGMTLGSMGVGGLPSFKQAGDYYSSDNTLDYLNRNRGVDISGMASPQNQSIQQNMAAQQPTKGRLSSF